jgi:PncC family amidohydrolase
MSEENLPQAVGRLLSAAGLTLGLAESCTGGLICNQITDVPGSSVYLKGGIVAYSYQAKEDLLMVRHETLITYGAVSEETAIEMARGARQQLDSDIGLGVTGIAGPGGGMPGKPVGLVHIALSDGVTEWSERYVWQGDRVGNKQQSASAALELVKRYLERDR